MTKSLSICDICGKNPARIFVVRRKNGISTRCLVCLSCAPGVAEELAPGALEPQRLYRNVLEHTTAGIDSASRCSICGTQLADIISEGSPGCCQCYNRFAGELMLIIESVQPGCYHMGKTPPQ